MLPWLYAQTPLPASFVLLHSRLWQPWICHAKHLLPNAVIRKMSNLQMVGVWVANHWQQIGSPQKLYLVEIGPGRGTLMADLLRGTSTLKRFAAALQIHLVEVSSNICIQLVSNTGSSTSMQGLFISPCVSPCILNVCISL